MPSKILLVIGVKPLQRHYLIAKTTGFAGAEITGRKKNSTINDYNVYYLHINYLSSLKHLYMKRLLTAAALVFALVSCKKDMPVQETVTEAGKTKNATAARLASNEKIKLLKARTVAAYYSSSYIREKAFYAEVANLAYSKQVLVHHKMSDGSWRDFPLSYIKAGENNTEIWGWELNYGVGTPDAGNFSSVGFGDEFALKYVVNGQQYWDNGGGRNYCISNPYITDGMFMQDGLAISADNYHSYFAGSRYGNTLQVYADLKNLNYNKEVTLVYTTDNWTTVKYAPMSYANTYGYGGVNFWVSPNSRDFEKWSVSAPTEVAATKVIYAIRYKVNGVEYWDNNYGKNYTLNRQ